MWSDKKSITLSKLCVVVFILGLLAMVAGGPWLLPIILKAGRENLVAVCMAVIYAAALPAFFILLGLYRVLRRLEQGSVFVEKNVSALRAISWLCIVCALICLTGGFFYMPWWLVAVAAAFIGLIVRVVRNVFARAVALQDEVNHTI